MSPEAQVRLGKAMQLTGILALAAMLVFIFSMSTGFIQGHDASTPLWGGGVLLLIYGCCLSTLGEGQVKKGRRRQAEAKKAAEATAERAIERGPQMCRTGGEHIYLGNDTTCLNGCGITRDKMETT